MASRTMGERKAKASAAATTEMLSVGKRELEAHLRTIASLPAADVAIIWGRGPEGAYMYVYVYLTLSYDVH